MKKENAEEINKNLTADEYTNMLSDIVPVYFENNAEYKAYKSLTEKGSAKIKEIMGLLKSDIAKVGKYTVSITKVDKSKMDEDKLLTLVKAKFPEDLQKTLIATREYIDTDALEDAMYKGKLSEELTAEMAKCMIPKTELRLNVKTAKGGKNEDDN